MNLFLFFVDGWMILVTLFVLGGSLHHVAFNSISPPFLILFRFSFIFQSCFFRTVKRQKRMFAGYLCQFSTPIIFFTLLLTYSFSWKQCSIHAFVNAVQEIPAHPAYLLFPVLLKFSPFLCSVLFLSKFASSDLVMVFLSLKLRINLPKHVCEICDKSTQLLLMR